MAKEVTEEMALGKQNKGVKNPIPLSREQKTILYEYRKDNRVPDEIGMQFIEDSHLPWLRDEFLKLNLGTYREFYTKGWINISSSKEKKIEFTLDYKHLSGLPKGVFMFINAPFIVEQVDNPETFLVVLYDLLKSGGIAAIVTNNRDQLIREGRKFDHARFNTERLASMIQHAGFVDWREIDFQEFDLAGGDSAYTGFFAQR